MACPSWHRRRKKLGLADRLRARSAARKTNHSHGLRTGRAMRRERRAADAPCGRFAFSKRPRRGPVAGQPVLLRGEPLFVGRMLGRDRRVSCRDGTLHLLLRRSLWHRGSELPPQKHSLVARRLRGGCGYPSLPRRSPRKRAQELNADHFNNSGMHRRIRLYMQPKLHVTRAGSSPFAHCSLDTHNSGEHAGPAPGQSPDLKCSANTARCS